MTRTVSNTLSLVLTHPSSSELFHEIEITLLTLEHNKLICMGCFLKHFFFTKKFYLVFGHFIFANTTFCQYQAEFLYESHSLHILIIE